MTDGYKLKPPAKHYTRDGRGVENLHEGCGALFGEINGKSHCWYITGRANKDKETAIDLISVKLEDLGNEK